MLKYSDAFQNAAWADDGMTLRHSLADIFLAKEEAAYISGLVIPLVTRAQSRWVLTDIRIDSVPPEVAAEVSIISQAEVIWLTCASAIRPVEP